MESKIIRPKIAGFAPKPDGGLRVGVVVIQHAWLGPCFSAWIPGSAALHRGLIYFIPTGIF
jgi:hypothetical protein